MQKLRKFLTQTKRSRDETGSSMLETIISIPLLMIIAGMLAFGMVKSLIVLKDNNLAITAANSVQTAMKTLKEAKSCYDLNVALNDESLFAVDDSKGFKISHTVTDCSPDSSVTIHLEATSNATSRVIFETTAKNFIQGSGYEASTP